MKYFYFLFFILFFMPIVHCLKITEVELNPVGSDAGFEWMEFFSESNISLEGYRIVNNDMDEIFLSGNFSGYLVYVFSKQWLDNSNESIYLYKEDELIDETIVLNDSYNDDFTWQFCDGWEFLKETKGKENCEKKEEVKDIPDNVEKEADENKNKIKEDDFKEEKIVEKEKFVEKVEEEIKEPEIIRLNRKEQKNINSEPVTEEKENNYAIYGFIVFGVFIVLLLIFRRKSLYKNEFE
jgi:hypothetical protein